MILHYEVNKVFIYEFRSTLPFFPALLTLPCIIQTSILISTHPKQRVDEHNPDTIPLITSKLVAGSIRLLAWEGKGLK